MNTPLNRYKMKSSKLRCILIDDDSRMQASVKRLCADSPLIELTESFLCPENFLASIEEIDFDLCILDVCTAGMEGLLVTKKLKDKLVIFVAGGYENIREAIELAPIDIIPKPIVKERFLNAIVKAHSINAYREGKEMAATTASQKDRCTLFNIAEAKDKILLKVSEVYFAALDSYDSRNKKVIMKDGREYTLMRYTFADILELSENLVQVNRSEIISVEAIQKVRHDLITLKFQDPREVVVKEVTLNRIFRKEFMSKMIH
jgi:DNA-binding LytR/AlgR family response regulator